MPLESIFRDTIRRHRMLSEGDVVVAAVSGGADSTALLHLLSGVAPELDLRIHVAHLDHGWRGEESAADRRFVEEMAGRMGLPVTSERLPRSDGGAGLGREGGARAARCAFLERAARRVGAARIATGHTRDDQAETVLLRLIRGSGGLGLGGIPPVRGPYIRPLLEASRAGIEAWLRERSIGWREDPSNRDPGPARNRVRHEVIPLLERRFPGGVAGRLASASELLRDDEAFLVAAAAERYGHLVQILDGGIALDAAGLSAESAALARRVLRQALREARGGPEPPPRDAVERVRDLAADADLPPVDLPGGLRAARSGDRVLLRRGPVPLEVPFSAETAVPGRLEWPGAGISLSLQEVDRMEVYGDIKSGPRELAFLDLERTGTRLALRNRRPGDAFYPLGVGGRKKIQDFFVDAQIPREARERVGLLTSGERIVWVVGHRIDERFKVTPSTRRVLAVRNEAG